MIDFTQPLPQRSLDIADKSRSNLFTWRGQFSPQLIENLLAAYCPDGSVVLDPFAGSGTVLLEAAAACLPAFGFEINPSAWCFSKIYEFTNIPISERERYIRELFDIIINAFPVILFSDKEYTPDEIQERILRIGHSLSDQSKIIFNALVVLLDVYHHRITSDFVQIKFLALSDLIRRLPYSSNPIKADLQDARSLPLPDESVDFIITSPPYINVFNYHQNYRRSVEFLGWDPLRVARSEIGSNRANRSNRFITVIQYCIDMASSLTEFARVLKPDGKAVFIVGFESRVLGTSFFNADIVDCIAGRLNLFNTVLRQQRSFTNRFGQIIREDILNFSKIDEMYHHESAIDAGRHIAEHMLYNALSYTDERNLPLLLNAISLAPKMEGTPVFNSKAYSEYHTRDCVMMVRER